MLYRTDANGNLIKIAGNSNNSGYNGHCLPVGSIFSSVIPQTSNNYHLLNGDSLSISGVYSGFYNLINTLVSQGYNLTCTANEYAEDIAKTGNCGKFVINTSANAITGTYTDSQDSSVTATITVSAESFKLPTITMFIQGLSNLTNIGDSLQAGLPNITGVFYAMRSQYEVGTVSGAFKSFSNVANQSGSGNIYNNGNYFFDASASNSTYGNSTTVQPASTQYPYYIVLLSGSALTVEANPTLSGSEQQLNSVEIGNVKYKVTSSQTVDTLWTGTKNSTGEFTLTTPMTGYTFIYFLLYNNANERYSQMVLKEDLETMTNVQYNINGNHASVERYVLLKYVSETKLNITGIVNMTLLAVKGIK